MFSPVYEDVSGLFGRPMPVSSSSCGPAGELHFPSAHFNNNGSVTQTPPQQQQQTMRPSFSLVDAAGNAITQPQQQSQQPPHSLASSVNGISFNTLNGSSFIPLELYLQQPQPQPQQATVLSGKPTAFQTADGVKYFLSASPSGAPILAAGPAAGLLRQQSGSSPVYTMEHTGSNVNALAQSGSFFSTSLNTNNNSNSNGLQSSSGDFSFFVANNLPSITTTTTAAAGASTLAKHVNGSVTGITCLSPDQRSRTLVNGSPTLNMQASVNRNLSVAELMGNKTTIEVFDPDFKFIYDVPSSAVVHLPPARLNITRLVLCRNYRPYDPQSCAMGGNCKFVHADCDFTKLEAHPIHVNYIWRHESLCTYPRLSAGGKRRVMQSDGQVAEIVTERLLVTKGSLASAQGRSGAPLNICEGYENNGMCYQGQRCNFIHTVHVDPFVQGDFKRAPRKRELSSASSGHGFSTAARQPSNSSASAEHSQAQSQVFQQLQAQQLLQQRRSTGSPDTETSTSSNMTRPAVRNARASAEPSSLLSSATLTRLQEAVSMQLHTPAATSPQQVAPSFGISLTPFAVQTLTNTASAGTLLYLPRGAVEAVVIGPVGLPEASKSDAPTPRSQK